MEYPSICLKITSEKEYHMVWNVPVCFEVTSEKEYHIVWNIPVCLEVIQSKKHVGPDGCFL